LCERPLGRFLVPVAFIHWDAVAQPLGFGAPFRIARHQHFAVTLRGRRRLYDAHQLLHPRGKFLDRQEARDVDREKDLAGARPAAGNADAVHFVRHGAARQHPNRISAIMPKPLPL
jgi:hypothetical protein